MKKLECLFQKKGDAIKILTMFSFKTQDSKTGNAEKRYNVKNIDQKNVKMSFRASLHYIERQWHIVIRED